MAINFPDNIKVNVGNPIDSRYLNNLNQPYISEPAVITAIIESQRYIGLTININNVEYWWKNGVTDLDLKIKTAGAGTGTLTGATNGLHLINSGTTVVLGGNLTSGTTINGQNSHSLNLTNLSGFLVSTTGTSVSLNTTEGLIYGGNYSANYVNRSLVDKQYVDGIALGLNVHQAAYVATTSGITLSGLTIIDGIATTPTMRVLVKNQGNAIYNGIYSASTGTWGRTADYNFITVSGISNGDLIPVTSGVTQYNSLWALTTPNPVVSGDSLQFTLFSMPTDFIAGTGINININTISLDGMAQSVRLNAITGATNGLTESGRKVSLGGTLIGDTTINASGFTLHVNNGYLSTTSGYQISGTTMFRTPTSTLSSIFIGQGSGSQIGGIENIAIGYNAFPYNTNPLTSCNIAIGSYALTQLCNGGTGNIAIGRFALQNNVSGSTNIGIGSESAFGTMGDNNIAIGGKTLCLHGCGNNNVAIGYKALVGIGGPAFYVCNNVAIGYMAGATEQSSNKLHIANNSGSSLIYGDFSTKCVQIGGQLKITGVTSGSTSDSILVWNSSDRLVKKVSPVSMVGLTGATNGLSTSGQTVKLGGVLRYVTTITAISGSSLTFTDSRVLTKGIEYGGNYSSGFSNCSLVTKEFVNSSISGSSNIVNVHNVSIGTYSATTANNFIGANSGTTIYLPNYPALGQKISVADCSGCALRNNICVCSGTISNISILNCLHATINTDYGSMSFIFNNTFWSAVAFTN